MSIDNLRDWTHLSEGAGTQNTATNDELLGVQWLKAVRPAIQPIIVTRPNLKEIRYDRPASRPLYEMAVLRHDIIIMSEGRQPSSPS